MAALMLFVLVVTWIVLAITVIFAAQEVWRRNR